MSGLPFDFQAEARRLQRVIDQLNPGSRGKCIIPAEQARTNTAYGTLTTPDLVKGIVLPTDGLLFVAYQALWKQSVFVGASAAIFLNNNQLRRQNDTAPSVAEVQTDADVNEYTAISSGSRGLVTDGGSTPETSDVTTGQVISPSGSPGGVCVIFAAAGTYDVSVRFKASSGSVTVKERKLWVWTEVFPS